MRFQQTNDAARASPVTSPKSTAVVGRGKPVVSQSDKISGKTIVAQLLASSAAGVAIKRQAAQYERDFVFKSSSSSSSSCSKVFSLSSSAKQHVSEKPVSEVVASSRISSAAQAGIPASKLEDPIATLERLAGLDSPSKVPGATIPCAPDPSDMAQMEVYVSRLEAVAASRLTAVTALPSSKPALGSTPAALVAADVVANVVAAVAASESTAQPGEAESSGGDSPPAPSARKSVVEAVSESGGKSVQRLAARFVEDETTRRAKDGEGLVVRLEALVGGMPAVESSYAAGGERSATASGMEEGLGACEEAVERLGLLAGSVRI